jgi:poly(A) polymerase Pap1
LTTSDIKNSITKGIETLNNQKEEKRLNEERIKEEQRQQALIRDREAKRASLNTLSSS